MNDQTNQRIELHGFNNLTKTLSFNMYDICYTETKKEREAYIEYIDQEYNADRLQHILTNVTDMIGAHILNIAKQDYVPQGSSVTILVSEGPVVEVPVDSNNDHIPMPDSVVMQLDKSHITVHTYPEYHPYEGISTFRADIDVSTCGEISPLKALPYLIHSFETDIMAIDYRVRGFTRDVNGHKLYIDHDIDSIQDYLPDKIKAAYDMYDANVPKEQIYYTKCRIRNFDIADYLFRPNKGLTEKEKGDIEAKVKNEMDEIFYGKEKTE
ncbi:adenosylmethionine decarboxylase [Bacillus sp. JCM 19034]|uniref:adenosylmethionine decarboxylase n=1 Tax=Bacillus sp. JCM 19034 TaxID=1481928 RepID=UPI000780743C|nr:adenosylmethionine decarboxylase [Bacillus sp. JCM 19034]